MTPTQVVDFCRNRHNAASDTFWSDDEIYKLIEAASTEVQGIIGLSEDVDTSLTTTASTQTYAFPTDLVFIKKLLVNNYACRPITFEEWDAEHSRGGTDPEGTVDRYFVWKRLIYLVPIPDTSSQEIKIFGLFKQGTIDAGDDTIIIPEVLHYRLCDKVIADMFAKDKDSSFHNRYMDIWLNVHIPAFREYAAMKHQAGGYPVTFNTDCMEF